MYYKYHRKMIKGTFDESIKVIKKLKKKIMNVMFYLIGQQKLLLE